MRGSHIWRGMGVVGVLVAVLVWSGVAQAVQPNPPGKSADRFVVLGTGEVLDVTTGLRWQQTPGSANVVGAGSSCNGPTTCVWQEAVDYCAALGGGYRLPEIKELISLVDYSQFNPALPAGHPFTGVQSSLYWSAAAVASNPTLAWNVDFFNGFVLTTGKANFNRFAWCAR